MILKTNSFSYVKCWSESISCTWVRFGNRSDSLSKNWSSDSRFYYYKNLHYPYFWSYLRFRSSWRKGI